MDTVTLVKINSEYHDVLREYTEFSYDINNSLRESSGEFSDEISTMGSLFRENSRTMLEKDLALFRGVGKKYLERFEFNYYIEKAYLSTTTMMEVAFEFAINGDDEGLLFHIIVPKEVKEVSLINVTQDLFTEENDYCSEREVLIDKNSMLCIITDEEKLEEIIEDFNYENENYKYVLKDNEIYCYEQGNKPIKVVPVILSQIFQRFF